MSSARRALVFFKIKYCMEFRGFMGWNKIQVQSYRVEAEGEAWL